MKIESERKMIVEKWRENGYVGRELSERDDWIGSSNSRQTQVSKFVNFSKDRSTRL